MDTALEGLLGPLQPCQSAQNPAGCGSLELSGFALLPTAGPSLQQPASVGPLGRRGARSFVAADGQTAALTVPGPPPKLTSALH